MNGPTVDAEHESAVATTARHRRVHDTAVAALVAAAAVVRLHSWTPLGDNALMRMWTDAVGTAHTPLVGGDARFGFNHLGPWLFYVLAVPYRLMGASAVGLLVGTAIVNVVSILMIRRCVRDVADDRAAAVVTIGAVLFVLTAVGNRLVDPWNPHIVQLPFFLSLVACWAVVNRHWRWLPWWVGAASFAVQGHITFLVPEVVLGVLCGAALVRAAPSGRRPAIGRAAIVAAIAWLPSLIDLVLPAHHNLYHVAKFFVSSSAGSRNDVPSGFRVVLRETGLGASWTGARLPLDGFTGGFDGALGLLPGLGLVFLAAAGYVAWRRRDRVVGSLVAVLAVLIPAGVVEMAFGRGALFPYLFGWVTIVGLMCWVVGLLVALASRPLRWSLGIVEATALALAVALLVAGFGAYLPRSPLERPTDASIIRQLVAAAEPQLSRTASYQIVHGFDVFDSVYELGVVAQLRDYGYHIVATPNSVVLFGRHMVDARAAGYPRLTIVTPYESTPADETLLALSDPLSPSDRAVEARLVTQLATTYEQAGSRVAADIVRHAEGDLVGFAGFVHPDPSLDAPLHQLVELRKKGRSIAVLLRP